MLNFNFVGGSRKATLISVDLTGYSATIRMLEDTLGSPHATALFNDRIQSLIDGALSTSKLGRRQAVAATTGDGALLVVDTAVEAHCFGIALHQQAMQAGKLKAVSSAALRFRIGAATGPLFSRKGLLGDHQIAGSIIAEAVRLEAACGPGELVIDAATFDALPPSLRSMYGPAETVRGKPHDPEFQARRIIVSRAPS